jgi:8-oxo-dGTP diphosphatase
MDARHSADPRPIVPVVAAVLIDGRGRFLLAQRPAGKVYAGYWEFPGGKIEPGESPEAALARELAEELGIEVMRATPWLTRDHDYPHARVRLEFFRVPRWRGEPRPHENQCFAWQWPSALEVGPMLPANGPILRALELPPVYGITQAGRYGTERQLQLLDAALARGLRLVQIREPELPAATIERYAREVVARARAAGARVLVNRDARLARAIGADGVHLGAEQLARCTARPDFDRVGASCHTRAELVRAAQLGVDFAVLGPLRPTPTHPGVPGLGWPAFRELAQGLPMPVYAIGGLQPCDLDAALAAGAQGIAAIRAAWQPPAP